MTNNTHAPTEWVIQWIRNNYQDHPNIAGLCDALREAAPPAPEAGWRPIATAPKDGTAFLAWFQKHKLDEDDASTDEVVGGAMVITSFTNGMWNDPDFLDAHGSYFMENWVFAEAPILWQPLPQPPTVCRGAIQATRNRD